MSDVGVSSPLTTILPESINLHMVSLSHRADNVAQEVDEKYSLKITILNLEVFTARDEISDRLNGTIIDADGKFQIE